MVAAREAAEERSRRAPQAASSAQEDDAEVAQPSVSEPDPVPFVPYDERPPTRRAPTARVRTLQELPTPSSEPFSSASDIFWMSDTPPALRDGYGSYTEADLNPHRHQTSSSVYAANDASNDYFSQLQSVFALFSDT